MIKSYGNSFILETINQSNHVYKFPFSSEELNFTYRMAFEKAKFTMARNQAGTKRLPLTKVDKAFQGMLAEYAVHKFIHEILHVPYTQISRYDVDRNSFQYVPNEEYDIKIIKDSKTYDCEVRSSIKVGKIPEDAFNTYDVIGPYYNDYKVVEEEFADFYIRPMYMVNNKRFNKKKDSIIQEIRKGTVSLYILTGAIKTDFETFGYQKNMDQKDTDYWAIRMKDLGGIEKFIPKFNHL